MQKVRLIHDDEEFQGILVTKEPHIILKLESGYNLVLDPKKVNDIKVIGKVKVELPEPKPMKSTGKKIVILHTGGTIASKVDYSTGAVIAQFKPEEIMAMYPEIAKLANIECRLISNIQSEMIRFPHYNILARAIAEEIKKGAQGIILTQGTDTIHYTSAALSFILENLPIPVIIVGSQRSSDRPSSDAAMNLSCAVAFAANTEFSGVGVCMHESIQDTRCWILPGTKARKMHTSRRDAFLPINAMPLATIDNDTKEILLHTQTRKPKQPLKVLEFDEKIKVGLYKARTHMFAEELNAYKNYDGLVIEGFALGHMPTQKVDEHTQENEKIFTTLKTLAKRMPIAFASQCINGRVNMNVYTPGRELLGIGLLGNYTDMTPETAYIKLAWLLSNHKQEAKALYNRNLRGEISERSQPGEYHA